MHFFIIQMPKFQHKRRNWKKQKILFQIYVKRPHILHGVQLCSVAGKLQEHLQQNQESLVCKILTTKRFMYYIFYIWNSTAIKKHFCHFFSHHWKVPKQENYVAVKTSSCVCSPGAWRGEVPAWPGGVCALRAHSAGCWDLDSTHNKPDFITTINARNLNHTG